MDFAYDARTRELVERLEDFMAARVLPAEPVFAEQAEALVRAGEPWSTPAVVEELKDEARRRGLWNLFLPGSEHGAGLTNLQYAPLAEIMGRSPLLAPETCNCNAPDTGNMELLAEWGTEEQKRRWLTPLLAGEIRSAFCMTEPDVASSDATNIATSISREGDDYVVNGRKWWSTGAMSSRCEILVVMGKTDPSAERHRQQSMVLVPRDTPGVEVVRGLQAFGFTDGPHGGHGEVVFRDVRVPAANLVGGEGDGFAIAQARLGPGRIHHCMRLVGMAERAFELMTTRALERVAFGRPLAEQGVVQEWIAEARVRIEQARLLVLKTAWLMDTVGNRGAHTEIQAIKIATPSMTEWVVDKAIQTHGGGGVSQDFPLAMLWTQARTLRFADGPDEVHRASLARRELRRTRDRIAGRAAPSAGAGAASAGAGAASSAGAAAPSAGDQATVARSEPQS
jgi:acyl-CoA dehydrogenase